MEGPGSLGTVSGELSEFAADAPSEPVSSGGEGDSCEGGCCAGSSPGSCDESSGVVTPDSDGSADSPGPVSSSNARRSEKATAPRTARVNQGICFCVFFEKTSS